jgi:formylglycine-generating enzyme required for sulfatase activity
MRATVQRGGSPRRFRLTNRACRLVVGLGLGLTLSLPPSAVAQELVSPQAGVVKITGLREGTPVQGSGFVVSLDRDKAVVMTASHVIEGVQSIEVTFGADPSEPFAAQTLGAEFGNSRGLAVLQVRGALPAGITPLTFETEAHPEPGEDLIVLGFPNRQARSPLTLRRSFAGPDGNYLQLDRPSGEGCSGSPVLRRGFVVGMVVDEDPQLTFAVSAVVARAAVAGWGVKLGGPACTPGEERTEKGILYVRICGGNFIMGSAANDSQADADERPAHPVTVSEFSIGKREITNAQYRGFRPSHEGEADLPATDVTWADAKAACEHFGSRLPTEAEWEYAARAGSQASWSFGDDEKLLGQYAWYGEGLEGKVHPVGQRKANAWGLHDKHGNVWEWVSDWYGPYKGESQDPTGPATGTKHVLRGGSFGSPASSLRSASRSRGGPGRDKFVDRGRDIGFRCALSPRRQP